MNNTATSVFDKYDEMITWAYHYWLTRPDKENLISFLRGYLFAKTEDDHFIDYISLYLNQYHQINIEFNTWIEQIDHYAYNLDLNWFDAFFNLLGEILEHQYELTPNKKGITYDPILQELSEQLIEIVELNNGLVLKLGDFIQLGDKIGMDYKQTKFYDAALRNPSWDLFYPSDKDFKHIDFYLPEENEIEVSVFGKVRRIFSHSISQIKYMGVQNNKIMVYTDNFIIDANEAIQKGEFQVLNVQQINPTDLSGLTEHLLNYRMGLMMSEELLSGWTFLDLSIQGKDWRRYFRSINGDWNKIKKS